MKATNRQRRHQGYGSALTIALTLAAFPAAAGDWSADLVAHQGEFRGTKDPIQIEIQDAPPEVHQRLYALVNELDVTEFAVIEGGFYTIDLGVPLPPGRHDLTLMELLPDGSLEVRGNWSLELRQSAFFESAGLSALVTQMVTGRVAERETPGLPERVTGDGAAALDAAVEKSGVRLTGTAPLLWDTLEENFDDENVTVGDWLLEGAGGPATLRLGHQIPATRTLAMDGFSRRGVSGSLGSQRFRSSITGFAVRGNAIQGFSEGLGIQNPDNRITGVSADTRPVESEWGQLALNGVWFKGRAPAGGGPLSGVAGDDSTMDGSSWAFEGLATTLGNRIAVSGGFSQSRSKFGDTPTLTDDAHSVTVDLEPFPQFAFAEYPMSWRVTLDQSTIGSEYLSLGNPGLGSDRETWAARSNFDLAGFTLNAYGGRLTDNVNDNDAIPRERADAWSVDGGFSPATLLDGERPGPLRWLGMPTLTASFRRDRIKPTSLGSPPVAANLLANSRTDSGYVSLDFAYENFTWAVSHTIIDTDNFNPDGVSSVLNQTSISGDVYWDEVYVGGTFQVDRDKIDGATNQSNYLLSLNVRTPVLPDRIYVSGYTSFEWFQTQDRSYDDFGVQAGGSIDWSVFQAAERHPGLTLSFLGSYQGNTDYVDSSFDQSAYQLYLRATLAWPITVGNL